MAVLNTMTNYFADMKIVDERLTKLEKGYEEISKLLKGLSMDLKLITNGGKSSSEQKVSSSTQSSNRTSRRTKSRDVNVDNKWLRWQLIV